jgi:hypothetical protein
MHHVEGCDRDQAELLPARVAARQRRRPPHTVVGGGWGITAALALCLAQANAHAANATAPLSITVAAATGATPQNTMTISSASDGAAKNYPLQFGRPFLGGAIPHSPQVLINGVPVPSQADVKNRYPDGSVEFAVIAVQIPAISANACDLTNYDPSAMPPYALWSQHGNSPVFNVPVSSPTPNNLLNTMTSANCAHFDGGQQPRSMITVENTAATSTIGGQMGFTEYPSYSAVKGSMFSSMVCNGTSWCPQLSVGLDEESGGQWPTTGPGTPWTTFSLVTATSNGDAVIGVTSPGGSGGASVYFNGVLKSSGPTSEPLVTQGNLVWGSDGDHLYLGPAIGFDQIFVAGVLPASVEAAVSSAVQTFYATRSRAGDGGKAREIAAPPARTGTRRRPTISRPPAGRAQRSPGNAAPIVCSISGLNCDIALSVTQQLVAGATKAFQLYNVSAATTQDIGFNANGTVNTTAALAFCGTVANCRYRTIYDQVGEAAPNLQSVTISFQDTTATNTPLTLAQMEALLPVGAATITLTSEAGATDGSADAGQMLIDGNCKSWTQGSVAQTMMCADDSSVRKYDIGFGDGFHPFRPRFYVTFWPATSQVFVRAVGENGLTTEEEDIAYKLAITSNGTTVYSKDLTGTTPIGSPTAYPLIHWANSRWSREFWIGGTPPLQMNIDNNLPYLTSTRFLPNLDTTVSVPTSTIAPNYSAYISSPHDIYDGQWDGAAAPYEWISAMGTAGGSNHIGVYPLITSLWLHTADWRMRYMALNQTDIAAAWPLNWRESDPARIFQRGDVAGSGTGLGRTISLSGRPTLNDGYNPNTDNIVAVGAVASNRPWSGDDDHQPSVYFPAYVLTGDPWYLDMLYAWAGITAFIDAPSPPYNCANNGAVPNCSYFRGPTGAYGGLNGGSARAVAWTLRGRAETAFAAPDGTPEKSYFTYLTNDALAKWEGSFGITGTPFDTATVKKWVKETSYPNPWTLNAGAASDPGAGKVPPLGNLMSICVTPSTPPMCGYSAAIQTSWGMLAGANGSFDNPWMNYYLEYAVGRAVELGFAMTPIQALVDRLPIGIIASSNPYILNIYALGVQKVGGGFWPNWAAYIAGGLDPTAATALAQPANWHASMQGGYATEVAGGLSMAVDKGVSGASAAYAWYYTNGYSLASTAAFNNRDPRWAIVPRTDNNVLPPQPTATPP